MAVTRLTSQGVVDLQQSTDEFISIVQGLLNELSAIAQSDGEDEDAYFSLLQDIVDACEDLDEVADDIYNTEIENVFEESDFLENPSVDDEIDFQ